jgi:hypothetical protein
MSKEDEEADRRLRVEEDKPPDPLAPDPHPTQGIVGKLDEFTERAAREYLWDSRGAPPDEGLDLDPHVHRTPESGRGATITLDADAEHEMSIGDEVWVQVPRAGRRGWTWEIEGKESVVDVDERAEIIDGTTHLPPPDGTLFVVRAEGPGQVAVRFEPIDDDDDVAQRRLRITVR